MVHLRVLAPAGLAGAVLAAMRDQAGAFGVVHVPGAGVQPPGDLLSCDVAREAASLLVERLRGLGVAEQGSITIDAVGTQVSAAAAAATRAAPGAPDAAVVWEQVEATTNESVALTATFMAFLIIATLISVSAILLDSSVLLVGGMVVAPEFGPLAGVCVALVEGRVRLAGRSLAAIVVGFPAAILVGWAACLLLQAIDVAPDTFSSADSSLAAVISDPDGFTVLVAFSAGVAGMLSLTTAKSSVLVGVLVSVTTLPAAANIAIAWAYADGDGLRGSLAQLAINIGVILVAGTATLAVQRAIHLRRGDRGR